MLNIVNDSLHFPQQSSVNRNVELYQHHNDDLSIKKSAPGLRSGAGPV